MKVSFLILALIFASGIIIAIVPFLGFSNTWENALVAALGVLVSFLAAFSVFEAMRRIERRRREREEKQSADS